MYGALILDPQWPRQSVDRHPNGLVSAPSPPTEGTSSRDNAESHPARGHLRLYKGGSGGPMVPRVDVIFAFILGVKPLRGGGASLLALTRQLTSQACVRGQERMFNLSRAAPSWRPSGLPRSRRKRRLTGRVRQRPGRRRRRPAARPDPRWRVCLRRDGAIQPLIAGKTLSGVTSHGGLSAVNASAGGAAGRPTSPSATSSVGTWASMTSVSSRRLTKIWRAAPPTASGRWACCRSTARGRPWKAGRRRLQQQVRHDRPGPGRRRRRLLDHPAGLGEDRRLVPLERRQGPGGVRRGLPPGGHRDALGLGCALHLRLEHVARLTPTRADVPR